MSTKGFFKLTSINIKAIRVRKKLGTHTFLHLLVNIKIFLPKMSTDFTVCISHSKVLNGQLCQRLEIQ